MIKRLKIESIIFDLDGTLINSMHVWEQVDIDFLAKRGLKVPTDLFANMPSGDGYTAMARYFKEKFKLPETVEMITQEWDSMVYDFYRTLGLREGAFELIDKLHKNSIKLGIGTSNSDALTNVVLEKNDLLKYMAAITTGSNIDRGKPFPDIYLNVADKIAVDPTKCIVIEDTLHGIQAAKNAGMTAIAIYNDYSKKHEQALKESADYFVYDFFQLDSLLFG